MKPSEKIEFLALVADVYAFYRQQFSEFSGDVWWQAMAPFDLAAVRVALGRHAVNPDSGQFMPKPADVVRMLGGTSADSALSAWSKVERAVRSIGQYVNIVFDDALIHRVIDDMGGWVQMNNCQTERDFEFVAKEFQTRYRGFSMRSERPDYPPMLIGLAAASNSEQGIRHAALPVTVGDPLKCLAVYEGGGKAGQLQLGAPLAVESSGERLLRHPPGRA